MAERIQPHSLQFRKVGCCTSEDRHCHLGMYQCLPRMIMKWGTFYLSIAIFRYIKLQAIAQSNFFGLTIQSKSINNMRLTIQIQFSKWIKNPIQTQLFLEKDMGQQILNDQVL